MTTLERNNNTSCLLEVPAPASGRTAPISLRGNQPGKDATASSRPAVPRKLRTFALFLLLSAPLSGTLCAQKSGTLAPDALDLTRNLPTSPPWTHPTLPEQYIWTADEITARRPDAALYPWNRPDLRITPQRFRTTFDVSAPPRSATLYIAGPRRARVFLNGEQVADLLYNTDAPIGLHVFHVEVAAHLRSGKNVLAIEAVRGRGIVSGGGPLATQQLTYGEVLAVKLVPAPFGQQADALVQSDANWRSTSADATEPHWSDLNFDDAPWPHVASLGPIESNVDFLQWSADAGMYGWPGYLGLSPALRTYAITPVAVTHVFPGSGSFEHLDALSKPFAANISFAVVNPAPPTPIDAEAPSLLLDLGREVAGRVLVESASDTLSVLSIAYGESEIEALATGLSSQQQGGNYLGTNILEVPPHGTVRGPKSGFRYVRIRFLRGAPVSQFRSIRVEGIDYPVQYVGSFRSSDPLLNRIWETGAYTAHLCMQDGIWDAVKRDRGRWAGDLDIEGRVIGDVFGDKALIEETLRALVPIGSQHVNGIPSYSALWITSLYELYQRTADQAFLQAQQQALLRILSVMDNSLDGQGLFRAEQQHWLFVDWSPGLFGFAPGARIGTQLQYVRAYRDAAMLLGALGDTSNATRYQRQTERAQSAAATLRDPGRVIYGSGWQLNALGVLIEPALGPTVWDQVLSRVKQDAPTDPVISPYFNAYVLDAMSLTGHQRQALDWIRTYWGGMLAEGATSFWESYDLRWPKDNAHLSLQADGTSGYFVSLAHGWSSGPTSWLSENVLGITPSTPGYDTVDVRPELLGLEFAEGSVATPHGPIAVRIDRQRGISLDLPAGIRKATLTYVPARSPDTVYLDGAAIPSTAVLRGRIRVQLTTPGHHTLGPKVP